MVFDEMMNPYDLIAEMIAHISHLDAFYYNSRTYRDAVQVEEMTEAARMFLESQPFFSGKRTEEITEAIINKGIPLELAEAIRAWDKFDQFFYALELLQLLESFYSWEAVIKSPFVRLQMENTFESLNTNVDQTKVLILPKVPSLSDSITPEDDAQKKTGYYWKIGVNEELKNLYYVNVEELNRAGIKYKIVHQILDVGFFGDKDYLRIAMSPIVKADLLTVEHYTRSSESITSGLFSVNETLKDPRLVNQKICAAIGLAAENNADILVFPEMLGTEQIEDDTDEGSLLKQIAQQLEDEGKAMPYLVVGPSRWNNNKNRLSLFDASGKRIAIQEKQHPFLHKDSNDLEDLLDIRREIRVLHIPRIGRLSFPICVDYLNDSYMQLLAVDMRSTLLICPSYSFGKRHFNLASRSCVKYDCYTVWLNTCAAFAEAELPDYIGLVSGPFVKKDVQLIQPKCAGVCKDSAAGCVFLLQVNMDKENPGIVSQKHFFDGKVS